MTSLIEAICRRRSVSPKYLVTPGPTPEQLSEMARAAAAGIDHGRLAPTRFVCITDETRQALADAFAAAAIEADDSGDEKQLQIARERALAGPYLVAVVARIDDGNAIPSHEQWIRRARVQQALQDQGVEAGQRDRHRSRTAADRP